MRHDTCVLCECVLCVSSLERREGVCVSVSCVVCVASVTETVIGVPAACYTTLDMYSSGNGESHQQVHSGPQ